MPDQINDELTVEEQKFLAEYADQPDLLQPRRSVSPEQVRDRIGVTIEYGAEPHGYLGLLPTDTHVTTQGAQRDYAVVVRTPVTLGAGWLRSRLEKVGDRVFNFYCAEQFEPPRLISHQLGRALLQQNHEAAIRKLCFASGVQDIPLHTELRREAERNFGNWPWVLDVFQKMPVTCKAEISVAQHLVEQPTDYRGALQLLPDLTSQWVAAYVRYLFNSYLSWLIVNNRAVPEQLPLLFSPEARADEFYQDRTVEDEIGDVYLAFQDIFDRPAVQLSSHSTRTTATVRGTKILDKAVAISVRLESEVHIDTFLNTLFATERGEPIPDWVDRRQWDVQAELATPTQR